MSFCPVSSRKHGFKLFAIPIRTYTSSILFALTDLEPALNKREEIQGTI